MEKIVVKEILAEQQKEVTELFQSSNLVPRQILSTALDILISSSQALVVSGIRRAGKSVLSLILTKNFQFQYINFDDERLINLGTHDLNQLYETSLEINPSVKLFVFDEIQNIEGWELFVNRILRKKYKVIITGSNAHLLSKELATHLTGRHISVELFPFSFPEFLSFHRPGNLPSAPPQTTEEKAVFKNIFGQYFEQGGFPEVVKGAPLVLYLQNLYDKIISRDISERYGVRASKTIKEIGLFVMSQPGAMLSLQKIAKIFEIRSVNTVKNYLSYLVESYLVFEVLEYSHKLKERVSKPRKFYAIDLGMQKALSTKFTQDLGQRFENLVYLELRRRNPEIYYLNQGNYEVDFVVKFAKEVVLVQVCLSLENPNTREREIKSLVKGAEYLRAKKLFIISWDHEETLEVNSHTIFIVPFWRWAAWT